MKITIQTANFYDHFQNIGSNGIVQQKMNFIKYQLFFISGTHQPHLLSITENLDSEFTNMFHY